MAARVKRYVVAFIPAVSQSDAEVMVKDLLKDFRVRAEIVEVHPYGKPCPKGADHAHMTYDGATFCRSCGRYLALELSKSDGRYSL